MSLSPDVKAFVLLTGPLSPAVAEGLRRSVADHAGVVAQRGAVADDVPDIVDRLRENADRMGTPHRISLAHEAAAEIERLRFTIASSVLRFDGQTHSSVAEHILSLAVDEGSPE